ncbi:MAG: DUF2884 family protein [Xanthomonadales bacterium]|nr:DUF2884 family protein [Xanthomonadales bacterium]
MRTHLRSISVALAIAGAPAVYAHSDHCNVDSDYDFKITDDALVFERDSGNPERVEFRHGELIIDGQRQNLSTADRDRVARFERDAREIVPEAKAIALDAVDLAAVALEQVATAFASGDDRDRIIARGNDLRVRLRDRIESANSSDSFDEEEFEEAIEEIVETAVPELVGGVAAMAMKAAFSGDEDMVTQIEARAEELERTIEREVEARADLIETRADALCERVRQLDQIESQFEFAMADGRSLDLLDTD